MKRNLSDSIVDVLNYFSFFKYPPTEKEIFTFLTTKTTERKLSKQLDELDKLSIIHYLLSNGERRYFVKTIQKSQLRPRQVGTTMSEAKFKNQNYNLKFKISQTKLNNWRFRFYIKLLSFFPQIKFVGLSGSLAMMNARKNDDIDLFIITAKNRLFTGRFIALILAQILGIRRSRINQKKLAKSVKSEDQKNSNISDLSGFPMKADLFRSLPDSSENMKDKVCLNLFFDESDLRIPARKRSFYVGHEVLQVKPLLNKENLYNRFLRANLWTLNLFPNGKKISNNQIPSDSNKSQYPIINKPNSLIIGKLVIGHCLEYLVIGIWNLIEFSLKNLQMFYINKHKTTEMILKKQLWFFPDDFEEKMNKFIKF